MSRVIIINNTVNGDAEIETLSCRQRIDAEKELQEQHLSLKINEK